MSSYLKLTSLNKETVCMLCEDSCTKRSQSFLILQDVLNQEINFGLRVGFVLFMFQENLFMVYKKKEENVEVK